MSVQAYQFAYSRAFHKDLEEARRNASLRSRIQNFVLELKEPFASARQAERLTASVGAPRYSIRISAGYRAIFDLMGATVAYRALANHDEAYRRAERLPPAPLSSFHAFPYAPARRQASTPPIAGEMPASGPSPAPPPPPVTDDTPEPEQFVLFSQTADFENALKGGIAEWMLFLPNEHRGYVTQTYKGPARLFGPSGTGKTSILIHRAVHLARSSRQRVLVLCFSHALRDVIVTLKQQLCGEDWEADSLIQVSTLHGFAANLTGARVTIEGAAQERAIDEALARSAPPPDGYLGKAGRSFIAAEIKDWIKGAAYGDSDLYQMLPFPKGKPALSPDERAWLFSVYRRYEKLKGGRVDFQDVLLRALKQAAVPDFEPQYGAVLVDEFQDLNLCALSLVKHLAKRNPAQLFFAGDHRQRIYRTLPSFKDAGIPIIGRSFGLAANYRNAPEIYAAAQSVQGGAGSDPDGDAEKQPALRLQRPALSGKPVLRGFSSAALEDEWVFKEITGLLSNGVPPGDIALLSLTQSRSQKLAARLPVPVVELGKSGGKSSAYFDAGAIKRTTLHASKGLEFPIVFLIGASLAEFQNHPWLTGQDDPAAAIQALLYVAMTRARDLLLLSFSGAPLRALHAPNEDVFDIDETTRSMLRARLL